jgi:single-strand DNA-binding protein
MSTLNQVNLIGNVGNVEVRDVNGGKVAKVNLATTERAYATKDGRQIPEETTWHKLVMWRGLAENVEKYVKKGDKLYVRGRIKKRKYTDNSNVEREDVAIEVEEMTMLTPKQQAQPQPQTQSNDDYPWPI